MRGRKKESAQTEQSRENNSMAVTHMHGHTSSLSSSQVFGADSVQTKGVDACKMTREREKYAPYLPKEIILNILVFLPAEALHDSMTHVCHEWHNIVNDPVFLRTHLSLSSTGVVVQDFKRLSVLYLEAINGRLKIREFMMPFKRYIQGSCHGLLLIRDANNAGLLQVFNPITKTIVSLPPLPESYRSNQYNYTTLACSSSGHFIAVHVWKQRKQSTFELWIMVCTVGIDEVWRKIDVINAPRSTYLENVSWHVPYSIGTFVYWVSWSIGFVLNVDDETMHEFLTPSCGYSPIQRITRTISLGTSFGWVESVHKGQQWLWEVSELTGINSREWTRVLDIDVKDLNRRLQKMFHPCVYKFSKPFLYLKKKRELWLHCSVDKVFNVVCLNVRSGNISSSIDNLQLHWKLISYPHVNSLL